MKITSIWKAWPVLALAFLITSCCKPEITGNVANTLRPQETNNWCWAATTQMLAQHFSVSVTQCSLANQRFNMTNCCSPKSTNASCPKIDDCNKPGWVMLAACGLTSDEATSALSWEDLRKQIFCSKKPMGYAYGTPGVVGHVVVIKGYLTLNGTNYVVLNDPWAPCTGQERIITYDQYADPAGTATHWTTWYNIKKP
ncbi:MAG TPA: papain-like cysteine protease family protein [Flavipsychrobacter sp.]